MVAIRMRFLILVGIWEVGVRVARVCIACGQERGVAFLTFADNWSALTIIVRRVIELLQLLLELLGNR
jgi:hypothetical protein